MSTLTTVPRGTTTFKPYNKPRYSKAKRYTIHPTLNVFSQLCCNCHQPFGKHFPKLGKDDCPEYQILNK